MTEPETLVIGLGNPILGDDGVGWRVIDLLEEHLRPGAAAIGGVGAHVPRVRLERACVGGIALMERLAGCDRAVIVDAITGTDEPAGSVWCQPLSAVVTRTASHLDSSHDAPLPAALEAGRALGARLPTEVHIVGITIVRGDLFGEELSEPVSRAVPVAADIVLGELFRADAHAGAGRA